MQNQKFTSNKPSSATNSTNHALNNFPMIHLHDPVDNQSDSMNSLIILEYGSEQHLKICSLVLSAVSISHYFSPEKSELLVYQSDLPAARKQLDAYFQENKNWPHPIRNTIEPLQNENPPTLLLMGAMALFFSYTGSWQHGNIWFQIGAINRSAIIDRQEWWRLATALTLHADDVHLIGNCIIGGFMVHLLCKTIGFGYGWFAIILAGYSGNFLNIFLRSGEHNSVGFSTAIFGAIGIFCGLQLYKKSTHLREIIIPLGAGAGLLALLGTEGEKTDLGAHFFGLLCGIIAGIGIRRLKQVNLAGDQYRQYILFFITLAFLIFCWLLAWNSAPIPHPIFHVLNNNSFYNIGIL